MRITEQWIQERAPARALAESGRAISQAGRFAALCRSEDGKTYWGECAGSAINRYYVSLDWGLSDEEPVISCSCDSRHLPCKHALGLMYELLEGRSFAVDETPPYVLRIRAKRALELARAERRLERARRYEAAARDRRLERQIDGLEKAERLVEKVVQRGTEAMTEAMAQSMERLGAELEGRGLPGARTALERAARLDRRFAQEGGGSAELRSAVLCALADLHTFDVRAEAFLGEQLSYESYAMEDPLLYEALGGVWNMDELREIGSFRRHARLAQLSFDVSWQEQRRQWAERSFWLELSGGGLVQSLELRPGKPGSRYSAAGDSCFDVVETPVLCQTPMASCPRVWWDRSVTVPMTEEERASLRGYAEKDLSAAADRARTELSDPLRPETVPALVRVGAVGRVDGRLVLEDEGGSRVALRDRAEDGAALASAARLAALPLPPQRGDALFGLFFCDRAEGRLCFQPYSLVTADGVVRLQF